MTPERKEILRLLEEFAERYPDWRFGQLVMNVTNLANDGTPRNIWDIEDGDFLRAARSHLQHLSERAAPVQPAC